MFATHVFPPYLQGFGQDSLTDDFLDMLQPVADVAKQYFDLQRPQTTVPIRTQQASLLPSIGGISPLYLVAGGALLWFLLKGKGLRGGGKKTRSRGRRR